LEWGGNWLTFKDRPHYQLVTGKDVPTLRTNFETGVALI
jgi:peptidoglycan L-alanyl-D-glutamate endopeptidase CwlK